MSSDRGSSEFTNASHADSQLQVPESENDNSVLQQVSPIDTSISTAESISTETAIPTATSTLLNRLYSLKYWVEINELVLYQLSFKTM